MKISVITPTFNCEKTILSNVKSVLVQTYTDFEQIIIDNLSSDRTLQIIRDTYANAGNISKLKILSEKDSGIAEAFNKGIQAASGDVIGILNGDDFYFDDNVFFKVINEFIKSEILFVHGDIQFNDAVYGSNIRRPLLCPIQEAMPYNHPTMFFRKYVYEKYGMFDASYKYAMDFEFVCRLETMIPFFREKGKYIGGKALVSMSAGGKTWTFELESIREVKRALQLHNLWNMRASLFYFFRIGRTEIKKILSSLRLNLIVRIWRSIKWKRQN
jgi:glycosyltransferase involved in cell wall biosynthesis